MSRDRKRSREELRARPEERSPVRDRLAKWREERAAEKRSGKLIAILVVIGFIIVAWFLWKKMQVPKGPWDVNKATAQQLDLLPGIGPAMAEDIIDGRPYERAEDLLKVKGIGEKTLEKMKSGLVFPEE